MNNKINLDINKEEETNHSHSTDIHTVTTTLDPSNPPKLTPGQKAELEKVSSLSDQNVRKAAETDPDCEPLDEPGAKE